MPRDASGNFTRVHDWTQDAGNNIKIRADRFDAENDDFATAFTNSLDRSSGGGGAILRNVSMSNHKFTSVADGTALTDSINLKQVQSGEILFFGTTGGTGSAYTLAPSPSIGAYDTGMMFTMKVNATSVASATINISALGVKDIKKYDLFAAAKVDIEASDLKTNVFYNCFYDGTDVVVLNPGIKQSLDVNKFAGKAVSQTISSDTGTYESMYMIYDTEASAPTDDLGNVTGASPGDILIMRQADNTRDLTIKHSAGGAGQFILIGSEDKVFQTINDHILCVNRTGDTWVQIGGRIASEWTKSAATNGYTYLPNGMILQWGTDTTAGAGSTVITFPIAFPNACLNATACIRSTAAGTSNFSLVYPTLSTTQITVGRDGNGSYWQAIGH